jgi:pyruvate carboxylase
VQAQLLVASGATLTDVGIPSQDAVHVRGYAIQCRVTSDHTTWGAELHRNRNWNQ